MTIKAVDTVRTPADMKPADLEGVEGRWLDVPRLQQRNKEGRSNFWCGRAAAAMLYNYYCKFGGKTDQYVGHEDGDKGPGLNGQKLNLRYLGGPKKGKFAGIDKDGYCHPQGIFEDSGWKSDSGELASSGSAKIDVVPSEIEKRFSRHVEQIKKNNPVVQFTQLTKNRGHIVVVCGYKKDARGDLWLRIADPCWPHEELLQTGNYVLLTKPEKPDKEFSEYWVKAGRLLEMYPKRSTRLYAHADKPGGHFFYVVPDKPVPDDHELVHKLTRGGAEAAGGGAGSTSTSTSGAGAGAAPAAAALPPKTGSTRLPFALDGKTLVTGEALAALYHQTERGVGGFFPLGDAGLFHSGAHLRPERNTPILAVADGEVVAARLGSAPGEHAWGDTGFVILRHVLKGDKKVYSLVMHLRREPLHPDRTAAPWLKRLLIGAMTEKEDGKKPRWRVTATLPTWKDEDKGNFSPANVQNDVKLEPGVYEEEEELTKDQRRYVKLKGKWIRAAGQQSDEGKVKELSPWADFDLETAAKNSPAVKALKDGKVAVLDADKKDGKHRWTLDSGETIGVSGEYLGVPTVHWSFFSKDAVFPTGSLPDQEYQAQDQVKLKDVDLSSKEHGTKDHTKALIEAVDPKKENLGKLPDESVLEPGDLRLFYRTPTHCWRARYQSVKALIDWKLDLDKLVKQDRYKSHTEGERKDFTKNGKAFLFWDELSSADDFPADGKAVFVHPVTALRLMSSVAVAQDHDDPAATGAGTENRLHAGEDVVLILRDSKGPLAAAKVTVKADGAVVAQGETDSMGELIVQIEDVAGKQIEVSVEDSVLGDKGQLVGVLNETGAPPGLMPGDPHGNQTTNGQDAVSDPRLGLRFKAKQDVPWFPQWDEHALEPKGTGGTVATGMPITAERFVFRRTDGKFEAMQTHVGSQVAYLWSIKEGTAAVEPWPEEHHDTGKDPGVLGSWSLRLCHVTDHPVLAGRVQNVADGEKLELTFFAVLAQGAPEHDMELGQAQAVVAAGGFSAAFEPHTLTSDAQLLNAPRSVYAKVKWKDKEFSLRDQLLTVYGDDKKLPDAPPPPPPQPTADATHSIVAFTEISREGQTDKLTLWSKDVAPTRKVTQLGNELKGILQPDGNDEIYIGATANEMHLATEAEMHMSPADALAHQKQATQAAYPDAPDWLFASRERAWYSDNGVSVGICAMHCKNGVNAQGQANGCTEEIRQKNLGSCHNAHYGPCTTAIQIGPPHVAKGCGAVLGACGTAQHDKSHCFLAEPVTGGNAEERERWYCALPMRTQGDGYPYKKAGRERNLHVLLINPANGAMVVCSQEDRGPGAKSAGHSAVEQAAVAKDEFKGKGRIVGPSYEVAWKLGLSRHGGDPVVLVAFVPATVPLGPVAPGTAVKLRKTATFDQIMGTAAVEAAAGAPA